MTNEKVTRETPEVRFDKRKQRGKERKGEKGREREREREGERERKRESERLNHGSRVEIAA